MDSAPPLLVTLSGVDAFYYGGWLLRDVEWEWRAGESWLLRGGNGAGKSSLLKLLRGDLWPHHTSRGARVYWLGGEPVESAIGARARIGLVSAEQQETYRRQERPIIGIDAIRSGFDDSVYPQWPLTPEQRVVVDAVVERLRIGHLVAKSMMAMSSGEARRVLIARALVAGPRMLLLDEVCNGLDMESRAEVIAAVSEAIRGGVDVVYTTHRAGEIVPGLTHAMVAQGGRIRVIGRLEQSVPSMLSIASVSSTGPNPPTPADDAAPLFEVRDCDVYLDRVPVLRDLNFTMLPGENWLLLGANGSGKSTFLRLLAGDEYPAHGGLIRRLGREGATNLWELRQELGLVSAALQEAHGDAISGESVVLSAFEGSIGHRGEPTAAQRAAADAMIERMGIGHLAAKSANAMSYGELRLLLIARALVHRPRVLLLDEPFNGIEHDARARVIAMLEEELRAGVNMIYATHHPEERIAGINRMARMTDGALEIAP